jgi:hypothetical protein
MRNQVNIYQQRNARHDGVKPRELAGQTAKIRGGEGGRGGGEGFGVRMAFEGEKRKQTHTSATASTMTLAAEEVSGSAS